MSEKAQRVEYKGRRKIYTDYDYIDETNVISALGESLIVHDQNRSEVQFLIDFEKGLQPLVREKVVREDIDITSISNLAHQITEFWLGYFWGNHMAFVQKSDKHPKEVKSDDSDSAITMLNEMYDSEDMEKKDQLLAYYIEVCGTCCQLIDIKRNYVEDDSVFDLATLNPLYSFVVYSSNAYEKPMMGVSYSEKKDGSKIYTCITDKRVFIIKNAMKIINGELEEKLDENEKPIYLFGERSGEANPFGVINIVEFERAIDRTGVFERQLDELNALNVMESDLVNDISQTTQAIWWGNDIKFPKDEVTGETSKISGGQWLLTEGNGNQTQKPAIQALSLDYDYAGVLANIQSKHDYILERAFTPRQTDQSGGSTTGATSMSSGWTATEAVACKQSAIVKSGYKVRNKLALIAIKKSPDIKTDSPLLTLKNTDIDIRPIRQKTFDMATKVNSLATMIQNMVNPRDAMEAIDFFPNLAETVEDSKDMMFEFQKSILSSKQSTTATSTTQQSDVNPVTSRIMQDSSDNAQNSPLSDL